MHPNSPLWNQVSALYLFYLIVECDINLAGCLPHLENREWAKKAVWVRPKSCVLIVVTAAFGMSDRLVNSDGKLMPTYQMPTNLLQCVTLLSRFLKLCLWLSFSLAGLGSLQSFAPPNQRSVWHHHFATDAAFGVTVALWVWCLIKFTAGTALDTLDASEVFKNTSRYKQVWI